MRFILGIIVGAALIVGAAYVRDKASDAQKPLVNWDVAAVMVTKASAFVGEQWNKLTGK